MKGQRNIQQVKERDKNPKKQMKEEEIAYLKNIQNNDSKNDPKSLTMELQINRLETRIEKMQEMFNKDLEEIKKCQSIMNNAITEIKSPLEGTNSRIIEAEDRISEMEDRMVKIYKAERIKEKRIKRNEDNLRDLWNNVKRPPTFES